MTSLTDKPRTSKQTVLYGAPSGDKTISSAVVRLLRYIDQARGVWAGSPDEFRRWAVGVMRGGLERFAENLTCNTSDSAIGCAS